MVLGSGHGRWYGREREQMLDYMLLIGVAVKTEKVDAFG